jgi:hypothetical protein
LGIATATNLTAQQLNVSGISTFVGITTVTGSTLFAKQLNFSGVSTVYLNTSSVTQGGLDLVSGSNGKIRLSNDGGATTGRISFHDSSNQQLATWQTILSSGSIDIYNYSNGGTANITLSAGGAVVLQHGGSGNTKLQTYSGGVSITGTTFTNLLNVGTGATIITTTYGGLVGINTANPAYTLNVAGGIGATTLTVTGFSTFNGSARFNTNTGYIQFDSANSYLSFRDNQQIVFGNGNNISMSWNGTSGSLSNAGDLLIRNNSISGVTTIGGNTIATIADFTQSGQVRVPGQLVVGAGASFAGVSTFTNGPLLIGSGTSTGSVLQTLQVTGGAYVSGSIGIGSTNPSSKLYVVGDVLIAGVNTANSFRARGGAPGAIGANNNGYGFFGSGDNDSGMYSSADGQIEFYTNANEALRIDSSQRVGIGTNNPASKLEILGGEIKAGRVDASSEGGQISFGRSTDNATAWYIDVYGNTSTPILRFVDASAVRASIDGSGNFQFNSGYGSAATVYGCRAWVNFDGTGTTSTNQTIRGSGNVSTVFKNGTGDYTINFTNAMPDTNYSVAGSGRRSADVGSAEASPQMSFSNFATGSVKVGTQDNNADGYQDSNIICAQIFR